MLKEQTISWSSWIGYAHGVHSGIHDISGAEIPDDDEAACMEGILSVSDIATSEC